MRSRIVRSYAFGTFLWTRAALIAVACVALLLPVHERLARDGASPLLHDLGRPLDLWARWDSVWYLTIAEHGYHGAAETLAFWPLYPGLIALLGAVLLGHTLLAGIVISLVSFLGALILLERLGTVLIGEPAARRAVLYLALFPMSFFFGAVYSESLYLMLAVAAFLAAERGRFGVAGVICGLAILTRVAGIVMLPPLALMAWRSPERRRALLSLAIAPALASLHLLVVWQARGGLHDLLQAQALWRRHLSPAGPLGGIVHGVGKGWSTLAALGDPSGPNLLWPSELLNVGFLVLFLSLTVVVWRRVGAPYGLFAALSLALPLSFPADPSPLLSLPRFGLAVFPFFLALGTLGQSRRVHVAIAGMSGMLLVLATVEWVRWGWIA